MVASVLGTFPLVFPMKQTKIIDFFRIQKDNQGVETAKCSPAQGNSLFDALLRGVAPVPRNISRELEFVGYTIELTLFSFLDARRRRKRSLVMHKKRRRILPFVPSEDGVRRLKQMASLATALTSSDTEFSNELTYMPGMAPRSSNQARLEEGGMQVLTKEDKETIKLCRTMQQRGECPPLLVVFDSREGFTVQADADIKDMTFIAEYTGDVDYLENRADDDSDCNDTSSVSRAFQKAGYLS
ncbi:hypothetical protein PR202_ga08207 [Eleusine coracana subsp. coracana]|uniref:Uncharacterized protein n=1 Tax=Eleusine coracana subsp. coracana TaxID=191504 RepID=A0AAV5C0N1_ELECO|nr:hypothetical protein PR202_ga08207 [Eleusine coracana subsp. coracana]